MPPVTVTIVRYLGHTDHTQYTHITHLWVANLWMIRITANRRMVMMVQMDN